MKAYFFIFLSLFVSEWLFADESIVVNIVPGSALCPAQQITFRADGTYASAGTDVNPTTATYVWQLTGGSLVSEAGRELLATFSSGEQAELKCTITDDKGVTGEFTLTIAVSATPVLSLVASEESVCVSGALVLTGTVTAGVSGAHTHTYAATAQVWSGDNISANTGGTVSFVPLRNAGDQVYTFSVEDDFGCLYSQEMTVPGAVADFSVNPASGEAKLLLEVTDKATNAVVYDWKLTSATGELLTELNTAGNWTYELKTPGSYLLSLQVRNGECTQSKALTTDDAIVVLPSKMEEELPNAFSPNGDGVNDVFNLSPPQSMKHYIVSILDRWGHKVHEYEVNNMQNPQSNWATAGAGWDGKVNGGNTASPGTYFYIIEAEGYDAKKYVFKGSLQLFD